jgi:hypothetical protein
MCHIANRSVDYATRALLQGNPDLIASARDSAYEIQTLHSETMELAHELLLIGDATTGAITSLCHVVDLDLRLAASHSEQRSRNCIQHHSILRQWRGIRADRLPMDERWKDRNL